MTLSNKGVLEDNCLAHNSVYSKYDFPSLFSKQPVGKLHGVKFNIGIKIAIISIPQI